MDAYFCVNKMKDAIVKKKKAWLDYLASNGDRSMKEMKNEQYKLQKRETKLLVKRKRERDRMRLDEKLSSNFRENSKLFWKEVRKSRSCSTSTRMNVIRAKDGSMLTSNRYRGNGRITEGPRYNAR